LTLLGCPPGLSGSFEAELAHVRVDGTAHTMGWGQRVFGSVVATRPSTLGDDLVDVMLDARIPEPMAANDRPLWDMWRAGGPTEPNLWAKLNRSDRYLWVRAAAVHWSHALRGGDRPPADRLTLLPQPGQTLLLVQIEGAQRQRAAAPACGLGELGELGIGEARRGCLAVVAAWRP
jgi:hypothetical protein